MIRQPLPLPPLAENPLVSVLLPCHNKAAFVGMAIASALDQSYPYFELIICDDGSTDGSSDLMRLAAAADRRVTVLQKDRGGHASALNAAYARCRGDVITLLDADDLYRHDRLDQVVAAFRASSAGVLQHPMEMIDLDGRPLGMLSTNLEAGWISSRVERRGGRWHGPAPALCFRRQVADLSFPLPERAAGRWPDNFLGTIGVLVTPLVALRDALYLYRRHPDQLDFWLNGDLGTLRYELDLWPAFYTALNGRLKELGLDVAVDPDRNLDLLRHRAFLAFSSVVPRMDLVRNSLAVVGAALRDDLMGPEKRVILALGFLVAAFLPRRLALGLLRPLVTQSLRLRLVHLLRVIRGA